MLYLDFICYFPLMSFFCLFRDTIQDTTFNHLVSFGSSWLCQFLGVSWYLMTLTILRSTSQITVLALAHFLSCIMIFLYNGLLLRHMYTVLKENFPWFYIPSKYLLYLATLLSAIFLRKSFWGHNFSFLFLTCPLHSFCALEMLLLSRAQKISVLYNF